jgi:hypothetical protein
MMILNKTNAAVIKQLYGKETDAWFGKKITIGARDVEFQGDVISALRVSTVKPVSAKSPPADQDVPDDVIGREEGF